MKSHVGLQGDRGHRGVIEGPQGVVEVERGSQRGHRGLQWSGY